MCRWPPALLNTIRAGASPAAGGMETAADCPAANTVSNRSTAALSLRPLLGSHYRVKAVGLVEIVGQCGEVLAELRPMAGRGSDVRRLDRRHSGKRERCGR